MILGIATGRTASAKSKIRAWLAVLCVSLFVVSGFVHAIQHVDTVASSSITTELAAHGGDTGDGDGSHKPSVSAEHCCGCASNAYLPLIEADVPNPIRVRVQSQPAIQLAGHSTAYEPPPPKSLT